MPTTLALHFGSSRSPGGLQDSPGAKGESNGFWVADQVPNTHRDATGTVTTYIIKQTSYVSQKKRTEWTTKIDSIEFESRSSWVAWVLLGTNFVMPFHCFSASQWDGRPTSPRTRRGHSFDHHPCCQHCRIALMALCTSAHGIEFSGHDGFHDWFGGFNMVQLLVCFLVSIATLRRWFETSLSPCCQHLSPN